MTTAPAIDGQITFLYATDTEACWRFWGEVVGLALVVDQGRCRVYRVAGETMVGVCRAAGPRAGPPRGEGTVVFSLIASDVDGWYAKLAAAGATILDPPRRDPKFGLYRMFAADPAGNILEVQEHPAASAKVAD